MDWRALPRTLACLVIVTAALYGLLGTFPTRSAARSGLSVSATPGPQCTVWQTDGVASPEPEVCTVSSPWWTAWATCAMTPIHSELWPAASPADAGLSRVPWIEAEPPSAGIVGHLFYGNRPLHVGGEFPDQSRAKVLWEFDAPVRGLSIRATELGAESSPVALMEEMVDSTLATHWPSFLDIPTPGCWQVALSATDEGGDEVTGGVTFIVIDG